MAATDRTRLGSHVIARPSDIKLRCCQVTIRNAHVADAAADLSLLEHLNLIESFVFRHLSSNYLTHQIGIKLLARLQIRLYSYKRCPLVLGDLLLQFFLQSLYIRYFI